LIVRHGATQMLAVREAGDGDGVVLDRVATSSSCCRSYLSVVANGRIVDELIHGRLEVHVRIQQTCQERDAAFWDGFLHRPTLIVRHTI
jgi:hypothetical protein